MLDIKVNGVNVSLKGSGSPKENVTDAIVTVMALVEQLAKLEHLTREVSLLTLFEATATAMRDFKANEEKSEIFTMPNLESFRKDKDDDGQR